MSVKIATWNICLGLKNKKQYVYDNLKRNSIDICLLQEVEIKHDYDEKLLSDVNYKIEKETNNIKSRCAILIHEKINYTRRKDLENENLGIVIIDLNGHEKYRLINLYRPFNPTNEMTQLEFFKAQLDLLNNILTNQSNHQIILAGDFNLDENKRYLSEHRTKHYFEHLNTLCENFGLIQIINIPTWERIVNNVKRESILDHIYVKNPHVISNLVTQIPLVGDHRLIMFELRAKAEKPNITMRRNWKNYTKEKLLMALANTDLNNEAETVQDSWNIFENTLIEIVDNLVPLQLIKTNHSHPSQNLNAIVKRKINLRKKLLSRLKQNPNNDLRDRIKSLNFEIRNHFSNIKRSEIRAKIIPGNSKSLWDAVKLAKNVNIPKLPPRMTLNNVEINNKNLPDVFADFFEQKVSNIVTEQKINDSVYNGKSKMYCADSHFMSIDNIVKVVKTLKIKNCEGHDRIPQRILIDGIEILKFPLSYLFNQIYNQKKVPEQWLMAKVTPIFKKGSNSKIENYRQISNLCSTSKIFEKLILQRLNAIEIIKNVNLTGKSQHGFKSKHSTNSAGKVIQSIIARALDDNKYAIMATLDLSSAFDVVNVELLIKRLKVMGIPKDITDLITEWLTNRYFYVSLEGENSYVHHCKAGTVQGSILGPILYALFVSPVFDLALITMFADDNYIIRCDINLSALMIEMKNALENVIKWFKDSGLKVNDEKTDMCVFYRNDTPPIKIVINTIEIISSKTINVLGVLFDQKLNWQPHVQKAIKKSKQALQAIRLIRPFLTKNELLNIIRSNFYSILYYNAEIWLLPSLTSNTKNKLLSASATPLKMCCLSYDPSVSFEKLHAYVKQPTPEQLTKFHTAILLYKSYNDQNTSQNWLDLFFKQNFNDRYIKTNFFDTSKNKAGKNIISNSFFILNNLISYDWLNLPQHVFKNKCKSLFCNK